VAVAVDGSVDFMATSDVEAAAYASELDEAAAEALVEDYEAAQLQALRTGLLVAMGIALASLMFTRHLPARRPTDEAAEPTPAAAS
jgi:hypothetical protein